MANNLDITTNDFEYICRTCLSRKDLKPLYQKYHAEMLMTCTVVKFAENDGLPAKICTNCINEINKAFTFAKRCATTEKILRKCLIELESEVANNSSHSQNVEPTIKTEEEIKPETIYRTAKEVLGEYGCMEDVNQEEDVKMEFEENMLEFQVETKVKIECNEMYDDPMDESNGNDDELQDEKCSHNSGVRNALRWCTNSEIEKNSSIAVDRESYEKDDNQDERCPEKSDNSGSRFKHPTTNFEINDEGLEKSNNSGSRPKRRCTVFQIEQKNSEDDDSETYDDPVDESYEEHEAQDETYSEKHDNSGSNVASTTNKMGQHKHDRHSKSSNRMKKRQKGIPTGEKPHICVVCSKGFSQHSRLKIHMRIHTGEKPYICNVCSKAFFRSQHFQIHMRLHTGEHPYACEVCSKNFTQYTHLKTHMRIHTGEKPYICNVCRKAFSRSDVLQIHMRIHTGEKPHICEVCSKAFNQSSSLKTHMRIHTGEKPYTCKVCSKAFSRSDGLQDHMRNHTKV